MKTKGKRQELAPIISNFLFHSPEDPKQEQKEYVQLKIEIREYLNDRPFRKIISQILFDLQKDVAGGTRERLFKLYKELELHHDAFKKLESWRWETVAQGILELSQMEVDESYQLVRKFINDRRGVIRKQAELATVSLRSDGIEYLMDTTRHTISEWQQLKLIEVLGKRKDYRPPQFKGWLLSQNKDVVLFALRLIKHFNQKGAEPSINELVKHKNDEIKIAAIQCIIDFNFRSAVQILKDVFSRSSNTVKINILNAIAVLGTENDIPFLKKVATEESSFVIVGKAQSTINAIAPETILPSKDIVKVETEESTEHLVTESQTKNENEEIEATNSVNHEPDNSDIASFEVEDIEFFDDVEFPKSKNVEKSSEPFVPAFELNPIEEEYGSSMDHLLGLVSSESKHSDLKEFRATYDTISPSEKSEMVEQMSSSAGEKELSYLELITENESDSELRFHAFKTLQSIRKESNPRKEDGDTALRFEEDQLTLAEQSIFYPLYHYTDDCDARVILLQEIMEVGDERDIPFLNSVLSQEDKKTAKTAQKAMDAILAKKVDSEPAEQSEEMERFVDEDIEVGQDDSISEEKHLENDDRIPMELFLLYEELGIGQSKKPKKEPSLFDFELSEEFFAASQKAANQTKNHE